MNISKHSENRELFSFEIRFLENTMNLSEQSEDKELFFGTLVKENTIKIYIYIYIFL